MEMRSIKSRRFDTMAHANMKATAVLADSDDCFSGFISRRSLGFQNRPQELQNRPRGLQDRPQGSQNRPRTPRADPGAPKGVLGVNFGQTPIQNGSQNEVKPIKNRCRTLFKIDKRFLVDFDCLWDKN